MVQCLKALAAFAEAPGFVAYTQMVPNNISRASSRESKIPFWPPQVLSAHGADIYEGNTLKHRKYILR